MNENAETENIGAVGDELEFFGDAAPEEREFCWTPYIPKRCVTLVQGDPQTGKSTVLRAVAAALSKGTPLPLDGEVREPMRVLYQNAEDDYKSVVLPHFAKLGAELMNVARINDEASPLFFGDERIERNVARLRPNIVIFDTLQRFAGKYNLNDLNAVTALFDYLTDITRRYDCAIVVVSHLNKQDGKAEYKGFGSVGIRASARSVLTAGKMGDGTGRFGLFHTKSNGLKAGRALEFEIFGDSEVRWIGATNITESQLQKGKGVAKRKGKFAATREWLETNLTDGKEMWSVEIFEKLEEMGISEATTKRVKRELNIGHFRRENKVFWSYAAVGGDFGADE